MEYRLYGIEYKTLVAIHDYYLPRTVITSSLWNNDEQLFTIALTTDAILKINDGRITIDFNGKLFSIEHEEYTGLSIV